MYKFKIFVNESQQFQSCILLSFHRHLFEIHIFSKNHAVSEGHTTEKKDIAVESTAAHIQTKMYNVRIQTEPKILFKT